ncbi:MAG: putative transposase [Colwellia sp.]|jgi:putative transposase
MWYNSHRLHSYLDYQSPNVFESVGSELEMVA